jgi:ABC-type branched-subunit amino acid transport system substrate-binding protein
MPRANQKKIIRLLGIGFDTEDGHVRITKGDNYDVLMGSDESHEYIQQLIQKIEDELKAKGLTLEDFSPEEFSTFVQSIL